MCVTFIAFGAERRAGRECAGALESCSKNAVAPDVSLAKRFFVTSCDSKGDGGGDVSDRSDSTPGDKVGPATALDFHTTTLHKAESE